MTRRERLENKLAKRAEWASKARGRSAQRFDAASKIADNIPLGQPILIGHHSESHARRDAKRIDSNMSKGVEEMHLAEHHSARASGLTHQLDHSIFSDDDDAITALEERITEREAKAVQYVALNKAWRQAKGDVGKFAKLAGVPDATAEHIANTIAQAYSWEKQPIPAMELANLRANIRRDRERIEEIKVRQTRSAQAEAAGGVAIEGDAWVRVTFAEKPARSVLDALKAVGFRWSGGGWVGERAKLPDGITV